MVSATPGRLEQVLLPQHRDARGHLGGQLRGGLRDPGPDDGDLPVELRVLDPVVEAAALERVVHLTGAVAGDHHDRGHLGVHGAELGHGHRVVREHLQQEGLELVVRAVDLVDQQDGRSGLQRGEQRPGQQEAAAVDLRLEPVGVASPVARPDDSAARRCRSCRGKSQSYSAWEASIPRSTAAGAGPPPPP
jgi:hypothetical protein